MSANPYQPPLPLPAGPISEPPLPPSRPLGIAILAVLHTLGGVLMFVVAGIMVAFLGESDRESILTWAALIGAPLFGVVSFATAVGLWRGKKWAWWLATLYYFQFAAGGVALLVMIAVGLFVFDRPLNDRTIELLLKHMTRLALFGLLTWYMMKRSVFAHFRFQWLTPLRAAGILGVVATLIAVMLAAVAAVAALQAKLQ